MDQWVPHEYQKKAVQFLVERGCAQLFLDPGLGKTSICLQALQELKHKGQVKKVLIVAPLRPAYTVWPEEIKKWVNFNHFTCSVLHGKNKDKEFLNDDFIHVINFDGLQWLSRISNKYQSWKYDLLIIDEISYCKNTRTQRFKTLASLADRFKRRIGLTGSPAPNSLLDIFGPQLLIDRGATFGRYITHFKTKFFFSTGFGGYEWKLLPGAEKLIYQMLARTCLRMAAVDFLDMPDLIINKVMVDLPDDARQLYKNIEKDLLVELGEDKISAVNAAVAIGKCQQIANGSIYLDGIEKEVAFVHDAKIEAIQELVEELEGKPVLIAYTYKHDLAALQKTFPHSKHIGSGVSGTELQQIVDDWNEGRISVLLGHPQSMGHGLNLQKGGSTVIWFSNTWSFELFDQFNRRLYRQGQTEKVIVHQIVARKTVDEAIVKALNRKDSTQSKLLNSVKEYANGI